MSTKHQDAEVWSFRISANERSAFDAVAQKRGVTRSDALREAVNKYVDTHAEEGSNMGVKIPSWAAGMEVTSVNATEVTFSLQPEDFARVDVRVRRTASGADLVSFEVTHTYGGRYHCKLVGTLHCEGWSSEKLRRHFELIVKRMAVLVPSES